jgi:hypothetical protein
MTDISPIVSPATPSGASAAMNQPAPAAVRGRRQSTGLSFASTLAIIFLLLALVAAAGAWFAQRRF